MKPPDSADVPISENARSRAWLVVRFLLGLLLLLGVVLLVVRTLKPELESMGRAFVDRFGLTGVFLGTFLADGFHCPIPPQFYMLLAVAAGRPPLLTLAASVPGSLLGGASGYLLARRFANIPRLASWLSRVSGKLGHQLRQKHANKSVLVASFTPIAFSMLCYLAGLYRLRRSAVLLLLALRVPKLIAYYYLVRAGWSGP